MKTLIDEAVDREERRKAIRDSLLRTVAHLAREHATKQDIIWENMFRESLNHIQI